VTGDDAGRGRVAAGGVAQWRGTTDDGVPGRCV
jgi:hypothetical protein